MFTYTEEEVISAISMPDGTKSQVQDFVRERWLSFYGKRLIKHNNHAG